MINHPDDLRINISIERLYCEEIFANSYSPIQSKRFADATSDLKISFNFTNDCLYILKVKLRTTHHSDLMRRTLWIYGISFKDNNDFGNEKRKMIFYVRIY